MGRVVAVAYMLAAEAVEVVVAAYMLVVAAVEVVAYKLMVSVLAVYKLVVVGEAACMQVSLQMVLEELDKHNLLF